MTSKAAEKAPPAGGAAKSGRLRKLLLILLVLLLVGAGVLWYTQIAKYKWSDPYKTVVAAVAKNADVIAALGEPVTDATIAPSISSWTATEAKFRFKAKGPKGEAKVDAYMVKLQGKWVSRAVNVELPDKKKIPIEVGDSSDDAPQFGAASGGLGASAPGGGIGAKPEGSPAKVDGPGNDINIDVPDLPDTMPAAENKPAPAKK